MATRLGIHVIGPRIGESIVLELPDGGVGVIDSFASRRGTHPVIAFLDSRFPGLKELRFFALTHPHADHCFRAEDVLNRFQLKENWIFRPFPAGQVQDYYEALRKLEKADTVEAALGLPAGSVSMSLLKLENALYSLKGQFQFRYFASPRSFTLCGGSLELHFLTPGDNCQLSYAQTVSAAARHIFKDGPSLVANGRLPEPDHNLASGSVLIRYGKTRALLMSDAEVPLWEELLDTPPPAELCIPLHFIKTAHHGSLTGYSQRFYAIFGDPKVTVAVMTPFNRGNKHLPMAAGVQAVRPHVRNLYCTNRNSAASSTGLSWVSDAPQPLPSLPAAWANLIRRSRDLAWLLVAETGVPTNAAPHHQFRPSG